MERCCTLEKRAILGNHHTTAETPQCETAAWEIIQPKSETMLNCKAASRNSYKWREAWHVAANRKGKTKQKKSCFHFNASCRGATKHRTDHLRCIITILISPLISKSEILGKGSHKIAGIWKAFSDWEPDGTKPEEELFMRSLCGVLQLSDRIPVESEGLLGFSAGVVEGHLRNVLVPGIRRKLVSCAL